jgi:hypothetical protein
MATSIPGPHTYTGATLFGGPPTYQNCLRAIGRILDDRSASNLMVMETPEGFSIRFLPSAASEPRMVSLSHHRCEELLDLSRSLRGRGADMRGLATTHIPSSYEDVLRAIGFEMDRLDVCWLGIMEVGDAILVSGLIPLDNQPDAALAPFERAFTEETLADLLVEARGRRQSAA